MPRLEHVGIAIDDAETAVDRFHELLGVRPYKVESVPDQQVRTHFLNGDGAKLELLEALSTDSPVHQFLDRHGEGLHHLAFEVEDLTATMNRLRAAGFELLSEEPQTGADDKNICFLHPRDTNGVLVEFCESDRPSWTPINVPRHDGHLSVFECGPTEAPPLLLLHGAAGNTLDELAPLMRRLEPSLHLVTVDLSGHGSSPFPPERPPTLDTFVEDARRALDAVDIATSHVFGFSLGGAVALRLADLHPNRVQHLALFQTNARWTDALSEKMQQRLDLRALADKNPDRTRRLRARHEHPDRLFEDLRAFIETLPSTSEGLWRTLPSIGAPTLVASVDRDPLFAEEVPRSLQRRLPNARLAILPGERHNLPEAPLSPLASLLADHVLEAPSPPSPGAANPQ